MQTKTLASLSICYLVVYAAGNGLLPIMPLYAQAVGATKEIAGYYVAFVFACISAGALLGGRLSDLLSGYRGVLAAAGALSVPATWLIGRSANVWQLALTTGASWMLSGVILGIVGYVAGKDTNSSERGRAFGVLGVMISAGAVVGGLGFGRLADTLGFASATAVFSVLYVLVPVAALLGVGPADRPEARAIAQEPAGSQWITPAFLLVLVAEALAMTVAGTGNMGRSYLMAAHAFRMGDITATMAVAGLVSLPFPFVMGWMSDRMGRKGVMVASFTAGTVALLLLIVSRFRWHFYLVSAIFSVQAVCVTLGPALVADIVRPSRLGTGLSFFQAAAWIGTIAGYLYSGISFSRLGIVPGLLLGALLPLVAVALLLLAKPAETSKPSARTARSGS